MTMRMRIRFFSFSRMLTLLPLTILLVELLRQLQPQHHSTIHHAAQALSPSTPFSSSSYNNHNNAQRHHHHRNQQQQKQKRQREIATLIARGKTEAMLMQGNGSPIPPLVFPEEDTNMSDDDDDNDKNAKKKKSQIIQQALKVQGVARIDHVLPRALCQELRNQILQQLQEQKDKQQQQQQQQQQQIDTDNNPYFANCLLSHQRWDLLLDLHDRDEREKDHPEGQQPKLQPQQPQQQALGHLLDHLYDPLAALLGGGDDAPLHELACLISSPGSHRQNMHPDHAHQSTTSASTTSSKTNQQSYKKKENDKDDEAAICYTCFVALQDILTNDMGPTVWIPGTHVLPHAETMTQQRRAPHDMLDICDTRTNAILSPKDMLLQSLPHVTGLIPAGTCVVFDSRLWHGGGANTMSMSTSTSDNPLVDRLIWYTSFRRASASVGREPGSLLPALRDEGWTLGNLFRSSRSSD